MLGAALCAIAALPVEAGVGALAAVLFAHGCGQGLFQVANLDFVMGSIPRSRQGVAGSLNMVTRTVGVVTVASSGTLLFAALGGEAGGGGCLSPRLPDHLRGRRRGRSSSGSRCSARPGSLLPRGRDRGRPRKDRRGRRDRATPGKIPPLGVLDADRFQPGRNMTSDLDATTSKGLRNRYAICGVGETDYMRGSKYSTRSLATWAVKNAMDDAGLTAADIDGMLSYSGNDSTFSTFVAGDLGIRLNFYMDVHGGGSSTEALVGIATGVIEAGMCNTVAIFRAMNGYSQVRIGGTGARSAAPITGDQIHMRAYGWQSAGQMFAPTFMRHLYDYGTTPGPRWRPSRSRTANTPRTTRRRTTGSATRWRRCSRAA